MDGRNNENIFQNIRKFGDRQGQNQLLLIIFCLSWLELKSCQESRAPGAVSFFQACYWGCLLEIMNISNICLILMSADIPTWDQVGLKCPQSLDYLFQRSSRIRTGDKGSERILVVLIAVLSTVLSTVLPHMAAGRPEPFAGGREWRLRKSGSTGRARRRGRRGRRGCWWCSADISSVEITNRKLDVALPIIVREAFQLSAGLSSCWLLFDFFFLEKSRQLSSWAMRGSDY